MLTLRLRKKAMAWDRTAGSERAPFVRSIIHLSFVNHRIPEGTDSVYADFDDVS